MEKMHKLGFVKIKNFNSWVWWHVPVTPATWEAEIRRTAVPDQPEQKVQETLSQKKSWAW
jgi:hypothetical protein